MDCPDDASDEDCHQRPCPTGSFPCGTHCISGMFICDGVQHCADGSDEAHCQVEANEGKENSNRKAIFEARFLGFPNICTIFALHPSISLVEIYRLAKLLQNNIIPVGLGNSAAKINK